MTRPLPVSRLQLAAPGLALAGVLLFEVVAAVAVPAAASAAEPLRSGSSDDRGHGSPVTSMAATTVATAFEIQDPIYEFVIGLVTGDSLGAWDQACLSACVARSGRRSALPWEDVVSLVRREARPDEAESCRGARVVRIWELTLRHAVSMPMPYSILGYHPGTLYIADRFVASEWRLEARALFVARDRSVVRREVERVFVLRIDAGTCALDVDGWLDKLLGQRLDDYYVNGFALCREDGRLCEVSLLTTRSGRDDYGQFDLRRDVTVADPDDTARGLAALARPWVRSRADRSPWSWPRP